MYFAVLASAETKSMRVSFFWPLVIFGAVKNNAVLDDEDAVYLTLIAYLEELFDLYITTALANDDFTIFVLK